MADEEIQITQATVDSFTEKLHAWAEDLPIEEKAVFRGMLARAEEASSDEDDDEVEGFAMGLGGLGGISFTPSVVGRGFGAKDDGVIDNWSKGGSWIKLWQQSIPR